LKLYKRKRPTRTQKAEYNIKKLSQRSLDIKRMLFLGLPYGAIAHKVGVTERCVGYQARSDLVKQEVSKLNMASDIETLELKREILQLAPKAITVLDDILSAEVSRETNPASVRKDTAVTVLKMSGISDRGEDSCDPRVREDRMSKIRARVAISAKEGLLKGESLELEIAQASRIRGGGD